MSNEGGTGARSCAGKRSIKSTGGPIRLNAVEGYERRRNDVIYCPPLEKAYVGESNQLENTAVVYFGGDIQDFPENMQVHHDSKAYIKYNLENTALMLRNNFPKSHIVVIKAVRMEFKTFSCYDNFVRGCNAGIPDHTPMHYALHHLEKILQNVPARIKALSDSELLLAMASTMQEDEASGSGESALAGQNEMDIDVLQVQETTDGSADADTEAGAASNRFANDLNVDVVHDNERSSDAGGSGDLFWWRDSLNLDKAELTLVAFSKGSVVLNQFIYEFHYIKTLTPDDCSMMRLVSRIKDMYWLDGGHSAPKNTWITSRSLLETLTRLNVNIHVHVTPYQVLDDRRPWIRRDEKAFTDLLKRLGASLTRVLHFDTGETNLFTHFEVLEVFRQTEQDQQRSTLAAEVAAASNAISTLASANDNESMSVDGQQSSVAVATNGENNCQLAALNNTEMINNTEASGRELDEEN